MSGLMPKARAPGFVFDDPYKDLNNEMPELPV